MKDNFVNKIITIDDVLLEQIKKKRKVKKFTQQDVAECIGVSVKKYSRIETGSQKRIESKVLEDLLNLLSIDLDKMYSTSNPSYTRYTIAISKQTNEDLESLMNLKQFASISETIRYCIEQVLYEENLKKVSTTLLENIRDMLLSTYHSEIEKMNHNNLQNEIILRNYLNSNDEHLKRLKRNLDEKIMQTIRADKF